MFTIVRESGAVKAVYQGHFHPGCRSEYDGVSYITLPAMCEGEGGIVHSAKERAPKKHRGAYFVLEI